MEHERAKWPQTSLVYVIPKAIFVFVLAGWEGSAADSRILQDAISRPNGLRVPKGN